MLPEQQQRILGYFIEEAKDHLNTIEQGLLNLQSTLEDPEMVNEVFRAAHSIKGGAAMLGLSSIQRTAHRLEDCFKILKEHPIKIDQKLESLFLGVADTLKALLEHLQKPFGLTEETANTLMSETEPVFQWLHEHLESLVEQTKSGTTTATPAASETSPGNLQRPAFTENERRQNLQTQVLQTLREMLQMFKQPATPETRQNLQECCQTLAKLGEESNWSSWCSLCRGVGSAVAHPENSYLTLAKIVITDIKQALELVVAGREAEIAVSQQLQALIPVQAEIELLELSLDLDDESANTPEQTLSSSIFYSTDVEGVAEPIDDSGDISEVEPQDRISSLPDLTCQISGGLENLPSLSSTDTHGPEVGIAELNTLADLFEGETPELDDTWDREEILDVSDVEELEIDLSTSNTEDTNSVFEFLLEKETIHDKNQATTTRDELTIVQLFGNFLEEENTESEKETTKGNPEKTLSLDAVTESQSESNTEQLLNNSKKIDEVSSLLELVDAREASTAGEVTPKETETIPNIELSKTTPPILDELFLDNADVSSVEELASANQEESKIFQNLNETALNELFSEREETNLAFAENKLASENLLDTLQETDELSNFFFPEEPKHNTGEIDSVVEEEAARQLEEILFAAAASDDIFGDEPSLTSKNGNLNLEDLDLDFQTEEQQLNFLFSSEIDNDLFEELAPTNSTISSPNGNGEVSPKELRNYTQQPEAVELTPEFTSSTETPEATSDEFDVEMLHITSLQEEKETLVFVFEDIQIEQNPDFLDDLFSSETSQEISYETFESLDLEEKSEVIDITAETISKDFDFTDTIDTENTSAASELDNANLLTAEISLDVLQPQSLNHPKPEQIIEEIVNRDLQAIQKSINTADEAENIAVVFPFDDDLEELSQPETQMINAQSSDLSELLPSVEIEDINLSPTADLEEQADDQMQLSDAEITDLSALLTGVETEDIRLIPTAESKELADEETQLLDIEIDDLSTLLTGVELEDAHLISTATAELEELADDQTQLSDAEVADLSALLTGVKPEDVKLIPTPIKASETSVEEETQLLEDEIDDLSKLLDGLELEYTASVSTPTAQTSKAVVSTEKSAQHIEDSFDEFAELDKLLEQKLTSDFSALQNPTKEITAPEKSPHLIPNQVTPVTAKAEIDVQFQELEEMVKGEFPPRPSVVRAPRFEQLMKVPVKHLDDLSNLVGELVVNRNTLEQDQERLRQFLDNLLHQVQQLSDVGARMQELYERSLLEASLLASRKNSGSGSSFHSDRGFSELEMDRFTPFHSLSQEMIELIVRVREAASDIDFVTEETERVARQFRQVTNQLQEGITRARMEPFSEVTTPLERGVRESAIKEGKQAQLRIEGRDTLIDKMILGHLKDPLTHLLNNAIAHGIEPPDVRQSFGKPPVGNIAVRAFHQGNQTVISVKDDGAGIDSERVKAKAINKGMITAEQARSLSRLDVYDLLFQPGFSTKDQADALAGRGVGLDVVRTRISELRGTISIDSAAGKGTTFTIRLPLTLSICKALCCVSDKARVAFPMDGVEDTLDIPLKNIQQNSDGQKYISWRDTALPFRPLKDILTFNRQLSRGNVYGGNRDDDMVSVVVVRSANTLVALQVDQVLNEQEIVIKQFEGPAPKPIGVAGATVLGDGRIMPIADVLEIIDIFQGRSSKQHGVSFRDQKAPPAVQESTAVKIDPTVLIVDDSITVRELLSLTFNKAGYRVEQARDGQEAWDKLRSGLPCDIVFCDIEMPRCDGLELLSRIQKDSSLNHLPIAMLTSRGADKHRQMAVQLGASGYFTKPYLEEALLEAASRMLKGEKLVSSGV